MAKPFGQVGRGLPGLTSVCDRSRFAFMRIWL